MFEFVKNRDNERCNPYGEDNRRDEVNGPGAKEIPEFVPTRHELIQMSKYWIKRRLQTDFFNFVYLTGTSDDTTLLNFAKRRIDRIATCLADAIVKNAQREAEDESASTVDAEAWHAFRHGTPEELRTFHEKVEQQLSQREARNGMVTVFGVKSLYISNLELRPMEELPQAIAKSDSIEKQRSEEKNRT